LAYTQIIVLGNGFDLAQNIASSYEAFFRYRYSKYLTQDGRISLTPKRLLKEPLDTGNCVWDYLFVFWHDTSRILDNWKDVESAIKDWVIGSDEIGLDDAMEYWGGDRLNLNRSHKVKELYSEVQKHIEKHALKIDFSASDSYSGNKKALREEILNYFANDLHIIEDDFAKYLDEKVQDNLSYEPGCLATYKRIAEAGDTDASLGNQSNAVLSFNYTVPSTLFKEPSVYYYRNVHGDLARRDDELHSGHAYHVIFGIDGQSHMDDPSIYQFTKTARVLTLRRQHILDDMRNCSIFDAQYNGDGIAEVKFFGHSLGEADYSYFQSLFDQIDLYGGRTKLTFCGTSDHPADPDAVVRLMTKYGETIIPEAHGRNLLHKLLLEDRLKIEVISKW
jgi:hypothetical protein